MRKYFISFLTVSAMLWSASSCEELDNDIEKHVQPQNSTFVGLDEVAEILSSVPLQKEHLKEVYDAVSSSSDNGYDEEYTMRDLFASPGRGVGDNDTRSEVLYTNPLRDLLEEHIRGRSMTKSSDGLSVDADTYLAALTSSDIQIYCPFSENWDGETMPIITYDPEDGSELNFGYEIVCEDDGTRFVKEIIVDEETAMKTPVWVVNRNSDAAYTSLELLRREDPDWGEGGGEIIVKPLSSDVPTRAESSLKTLILKEFTMKRHYDSWFAGASEFFVKAGSVEDFTASTEAELKLYEPTVTDFMVVVKRSQIGKPVPFNAVIVSDWTPQMTHCAFMITEDDGGTKTDWDCTALVRVASKSYGVEIKLPFNSRDDIVWRGQLSSRWLEQNSNIVGHFGDVDLTFEVVEY